MTRSATLINLSLICGILFLLTPALADAQRRGGSVGRGTGVGAANGSGVGAANGSGVGTMGTPRRTVVVDFADRNGVIGDGVVGAPGCGIRPGNGRPIARPGVAAAAARRVPIGTVIEVLPPDCEMTFIDEVEYYYCTGQYYQPMGTETAPLYTAVEPYFPEQY